MNYELVYQAVNLLALVAWLYLLLLYRRPETTTVLAGTVVAALCITYAVCLYQNLGPTDPQSFQTLAGLQSLQGSAGAVLTGWIHYLAFDLLAGLWMVGNAQQHGISRWLLSLCLVFTFMLGPVGVLLYFVVRWWRTGQYWSAHHAQ
ncbi:ABA4-like family protein [Phnomibacter ginsenosidimutans]|uniref:DUF4281 domain-containing protein n=1 Tax=Phnomibacter ginsenosidimutans TaxID=2676868 RepID=A0A6I6H670_9BACT|nr:ABA4-like family protein [Phnomibacter ginsenosidimutans]QGW29811.1 DUF4281 domain-containing protein [Phnomibacter ginsenosidimutans]